MAKPKSRFDKLLRFAEKRILDELTTDSGRLNLYFITGLLALVIVSGGFDIFQAAVRVARPDYEHGLPSVGFFIARFGYLGLACIAIVALVEVTGRRSNE